MMTKKIRHKSDVELDTVYTLFTHDIENLTHLY